MPLDFHRKPRPSHCCRDLFTGNEEWWWHIDSKFLINQCGFGNWALPIDYSNKPDKTSSENSLFPSYFISFSHQCGLESIGWVHWFCTLLRGVFLQVLRFSPILKNQCLIWFLSFYWGPPRGCLFPCFLWNWLVFPCSRITSKLVFSLLTPKMLYVPFFPKILCFCSPVPQFKLARFYNSPKSWETSIVQYLQWTQF